MTVLLYIFFFFFNTFYWIIVYIEIQMIVLSVYLFPFSLLPSESDCIIHGYIKKLGGPFTSAWQTRYAKLYPNRVELHSESSSGKPELIFMDQIDEVSSDFVQIKGENCIVLKTKDSKIVLTNPVGIPSFFPRSRIMHP